ncbi:DUF2271 domain-containing protein [Pseudoxanthomonas wuyuanensis]
MKRGWKAALWLAAACAWNAQAAALQRHQREDVLGTSFEMIVAGDDARAEAAVDAALAEIQRLEAALSTWRTDSELARFNRGQSDGQASADLRAVLAACERWREASDGAFSCRLGALQGIWRNAADSGRGQLPDRVALRQRARAIARFEFDGTAQPLAQSPDLQWQVDGLAKGYILDRAMQRARAAAPQAYGIKLDIGGDAIYWGQPASGQAWRVAIADPAAPRDNGPAIATLALCSQALAASGHRSRGYRVGRRLYSHILDPNEGWPVAYAPSATVVAADAASADALATALSVMPIRDGLTLVESLPGTEALIVGERGVAFASSGWHALLATDGGEPAAEPERLAIDYEIPAQTGERYRRPYLALWIATPAGAPVRQLLVLGDRSRWLRELPQWWRHYGRDDEAAVHGIARPTRAPGRYSLGWDGRDDFGRALPQGDYLLQIEAAREHGGHERLSLPFRLDGTAVLQQAQGRREVGRIELRTAPGPWP